MSATLLSFWFRSDAQMIAHPLFPCEPWQVRETALDMDVLAQTESLFALSNGHIGWRGNLDEGEPNATPGCYLNGVFESREVPYAEAGYGYPESGQAMINVTNGKLIRLLVDDEPFDIRYGDLLSHERTLDLQNGQLRRKVEWRSPSGDKVRVRTTRIVSFSQRAIAAVVFEVEPIDDTLRIVVQSELVANESILPADDADPRVASRSDHTLAACGHGVEGLRATLIHCTRGTGQLISAAMDHEVTGPSDVQTSMESSDDFGRLTVTARLKPGQKLRLVKYVAYGWSTMRTLPALRDQVHAALASARHSGWEGLLEEQREYLDDFWNRSDVHCEGDEDLQQAVRFGLFHVLQSGARAEGRAVPAKGLTGPGYDGHTFWDTETFVFPFLTYSHPDVVSHALRWRHSTLPMAKARAQLLGLRGATFPWRTINGEESSRYWPAGTAGFHINADIADCVTRYIDVTGDVDFEREVGLELLVETARLWISLGYFESTHNDPESFRIDGVTGPDEYSAIADNNVFTNLMAAHNLRSAAASARRHHEAASGLDVTEQEIDAWLHAASAMLIVYDEALQIHPQAEGFTSHNRWDFANTPSDNYPLLLHYPYFDLYRKQVTKQADLVLAMHLRSEAFTAEQKARNFAYYEAITVRDSSLSAATQAVIAAEVGHLELALDYLMETAAVDLNDLQGNTRDGIHLAAQAGIWTGLVAGFGGLRQVGTNLLFAPKLPSTMSMLAFNVQVGKTCLRVAIHADECEYMVMTGPSITISHYGEQVDVAVDAPTTQKIPELPTLEAPTQPEGRCPLPHEQVRARMRAIGPNSNDLLQAPTPYD